MGKLRVLYITNNHPEVWVGGCEVYSYELHRAMLATGQVDSVLLARTNSGAHGFRQRTPFRSLDNRPDQVLWHQEGYDHLYMTSTDKAQYTEHFRRFLEALRPEVVHIQHTHGLGVDLIRQIRHTLPDAPIVYTLHEFLPICFADGLMIRRDSKELCHHASPTRCHGCFPHVRPQEFFLRERFIKSHFHLVDLFLAPSQQLLERYAAWGLPQKKLRFLDYGRIHPQLPPEDPTPPPNHFGFFGQITHHKGILVLLRAMRILKRAGKTDLHLFINGANLETQDPDTRQEVEEHLRECAASITFLGRYETADLADRMRDLAWVVVPSIWWENSPLVIQEAFMHRRPVLCSNIGGMHEKVQDGVNGLHFRVQDAADLAATMERAAGSPHLWKGMRDAIPTVPSMEDAVVTHREIYGALLNGRTNS